MSIVKLIEMVRDSADKGVQLDITVKNGSIRMSMEKWKGNTSTVMIHGHVGGNLRESDWYTPDGMAQEILDALAVGALQQGKGPRGGSRLSE